MISTCWPRATVPPDGRQAARDGLSRVRRSSSSGIRFFFFFRFGRGGGPGTAAAPDRTRRKRRFGQHRGSRSRADACRRRRQPVGNEVDQCGVGIVPPTAEMIGIVARRHRPGKSTSSLKPPQVLDRAAARATISRSGRGMGPIGRIASKRGGRWHLSAGAVALDHPGQTMTLHGRFGELRCRCRG